MITVTEFYSPTCIPCKMIRRSLEAMAKDREDSIKLEFIDGTQNKELCMDRGIMSFPHLVVTDSEGKELLSEKGTFVTLSKIRELAH